MAIDGFLWSEGDEISSNPHRCVCVFELSFLLGIASPFVSIFYGFPFLICSAHKLICCTHTRRDFHSPPPRSHAPQTAWQSHSRAQINPTQPNRIDFHFIEQYVIICEKSPITFMLWSISFVCSHVWAEHIFIRNWLENMEKRNHISDFICHLRWSSVWLWGVLSLR